MYGKRDRTGKEKPKSRPNSSNRSSLSSTAYHDIKAVVDRILDQRQQQHTRELIPPKKNHNETLVKSYIHQPIMNNFIVVTNPCSPVG